MCGKSSTRLSVILTVSRLSRAVNTPLLVQIVSRVAIPNSHSRPRGSRLTQASNEAKTGIMYDRRCAPLTENSYLRHDPLFYSIGLKSRNSLRLKLLGFRHPLASPME